MSPPPMRATSISISTPDPRELAQFYARLLGVDVSASEGPREGEPPTAGWAQLRPVEGRLAMTLNFEWDEHYRAPVWPTATPSRMGWPSLATAGAVETVPDLHRQIPPVPTGAEEQQVMAHLDLWVGDLQQAQEWAIECGATRHPHQPQREVVVMVDPHGHPFCLFTG